ncbi:MAG TPA: CDP-alcohol phosphatidyltransferase family protein [Polyangia bacterium]|nr:CDP-alcohol phosphatidyltransferase family protein [Polyangia bacterium]
MSPLMSPEVSDIAFLAGFVLFFLLALLTYAVRVRLGLSTLPPMRAGGAGRRLLAPLLVGYFYWLTKPVCRLAVRSGQSASFFTALGLVGALLTAIAVATGHFALGSMLLIATGALDVMDGEVARALHLSSPRGAFFDSTIDRVADGLMFGGCVVYYAGTVVMYAALVALIMSFVISYARSRAEALGLPGAEGLMQRADRITLLSIALAFSPLVAHRVEGFVPHPLYAVTAVALFLMALLNTVTAVSRIVWTMQRLGDPALTPVRPRPAEPARVERLVPVEAPAAGALRGQPHRVG